MSKKIIVVVGDLNVLKTPYVDLKTSLWKYIRDNIDEDVLVESLYHIAPSETHWRGLRSHIEPRFTHGRTIFHTHSLDEIKVIAELWAEDKYNFSFYRIQKRRDGNIIHVEYDLETLQTSLDSNIEMR